MLDELDTAIPSPVVAVMLKPSTVTQLLPESVKPFVFPVTVTLAPGAVVNTIGALDVPEFAGVTFSAYVPEATATVSPAVACAAAPPMVQNGWLADPAPASVQL